MSNPHPLHGVSPTIRMLETWKQRCGRSIAMCEVMVKTLLQISRTDLAEKVIVLGKSSRALDVACYSGSVLEWLGRIINSVITELPNTLTTPSIYVNLIGRNIRYAH